MTKCSFKLQNSNKKRIFFLSAEQDIFLGQENCALLISDHVVSVLRGRKYEERIHFNARDQIPEVSATIHFIYQR